MKIAPPHRFVSKTLAAAVVLALAGGGAAAQASTPTGDAYYERAFVLAAHRKCGLFDAALTAALDAATLQARGAALRAGRPASELAAVATRAQARADGVACDDADLKRVGTRVRSGFAGWSRAAQIEFPGGAAPWRADRFSGREVGWRLAQDGAAGASPVRFGLVGAGPTATEATAVVSFVGRPRPYAARLVMRDGARAPRPWLAGDGLPPQTARRAVFAARNETAARGLLTPGARQGEAWVFPAEAGEALAGLDPREVFLIEFLFRDDSVATARFEAGDFAAARAFLAMGPI